MGLREFYNAASEMTKSLRVKEKKLNIYMERPSLYKKKNAQNSGSLCLNNSLLFYILKCL